MIAFEYNVFYNNSLVCMKFKTAGFPHIISKKKTFKALSSMCFALWNILKNRFKTKETENPNDNTYELQNSLVKYYLVYCVN